MLFAAAGSRYETGCMESARLAPDEGSAAALVEKADAALYAAKQAERNRAQQAD